MSNQEPIEELQVWYDAQCDGDWEHSLGVEITTMDNPGWCLKVDLEGTILEGEPFLAVSHVDEQSLDWFECKVEGMKFVGYGGPRRLNELIKTFLLWAKNRKDWLAIPTQATLEQLDLIWYKSLEEETGPEACRKAGCNSLRMRHSIFCRKHHFEQLKGYLPEE